MSYGLGTVAEEPLVAGEDLQWFYCLCGEPGHHPKLARGRLAPSEVLFMQCRKCRQWVRIDGADPSKRRYATAGEKETYRKLCCEPPCRRKLMHARFERGTVIEAKCTWCNRVTTPRAV